MADWRGVVWERAKWKLTGGSPISPMATAKNTRIVFLLFAGYFCRQKWRILQLSLNFSPLLPLFSAELLLFRGRRENTPNHSHCRKDYRRQGLTMSNHSPPPRQRGATLGVVATLLTHAYIHTYVCTYMYITNETTQKAQATQALPLCRHVHVHVHD